MLVDLVLREHAVIYGLAAGGGRLGAEAASAAAVEAVQGAYDVHRLRRDQLIAVLQQRGATAPPAEPAYQLPPSANAAVTGAFLATLEDKIGASYDTALGELTEPSLRQMAVTAIRDGARFRTQILLAVGQPASAAAPALPGRPG
ncbi:MAG TPA: DUF4439 domain-containing protein [Mycobacteriales bacterium]|nr:DUF4439 domain-containing protein [Mycobacteriales bacterium]